jgi:lysine-N-methylase
MSLPIVILNNEEKWDCHQCGFCCRGSVIPLRREDVERLRSQKWHEHRDFVKTKVMYREPAVVGRVRLAHQADGSCVFLDKSGLCRIHSEFGIEAKPTVCQTFPLQLIPLGSHVVLTTRRSCPSAGADLGQSTTTRKRFIQRLVDEKRLKSDALPPPLMKAGETRSWKVLQPVLALAGNLLSDIRYPPVRRLTHVLQFASLLEAAKTRRLNDAQVFETAQALAESTAERSKTFFTDRREPAAYAKILFRLMAVDCARLHPLCRHKSTWMARYELIRTAIKIVRGKGQTPNIDRLYPDTIFEELEKPRGVMLPEVYLPLTRFIETTSASFMYAIADRQGWTMIESIRGLALLFPVGLWLVRWLTQGRQPSVQDMLNVVVALDRSQGYAPLSGILHRLRLSTLSFDNQLERLVVWSAR